MHQNHDAKDEEVAGKTNRAANLGFYEFRVLVTQVSHDPIKICAVHWESDCGQERKARRSRPYHVTHNVRCHCNHNGARAISQVMQQQQGRKVEVKIERQPNR
jgi:hypothetical protein